MSELDEELKRFEAELAQITQTQDEQHDTPSQSIKTPSTLIAPRILIAPRQVISANKSNVSNTALLNKGVIASASPNIISKPSVPPITVPSDSQNEPNDPQPINPQSNDSQSSIVSSHPNKKPRVANPTIRSAAGTVWKDETLSEWPDNDFRVFVGDLGVEVTDAMLAKAFSHYTSFAMARVVRDKKTNTSRGYGFVSFTDHHEGVTALKEMQGKYCGNRPMKLKRSEWQKRAAPAPSRSRFKPRH